MDRGKMIYAMLQQESGGDPRAVSPKGAQGLMQIMPATARDPGYGVKPLQGWDGVNPMTASPAEQIRFATDYTAAMERKFGDPLLAVAAYNAGPGAVENHGGIPPYKETQNYVKNVVQNYNGGNVASTDWRSRATPIQTTQPAAQGGAPGGDWRSRATPVQPAASVAPAAAPAAPTRDMGAGTAAVQGFNSAIPFGERIAAGLGAGVAYGYDKLSGLDTGQSLGEYYDEARGIQKDTREANPGAYTAGAVTGLAATLPAASTKVLTGTRATTGVRGAVNAVPEMLSSVGNFVRGGQVAEGAGTAAKLANLGGKALRSAAVAAPAGAAYAYGASEHDLLSKEAVADAASGAKLAATLGAAVPVAGAAIDKVIKPKVSKEVAALAKRAKEAFGIDLSLDQIAPSNVRDTVQKISQNIPGSGVDAFQAKQAGQWQRAVAKTIGQDADNLGPETIGKFLDDANTKFESIVKHTDMKFDTKSYDAIEKIAKTAKSNITKDYADIVVGKAENLANQLFKVRSVPSGVEYTAKQLNGKKLASIRSQLIKELPNVAGDARQHVAELVDVIDDIAQKNLAKADIEQLGIARREWRNFKTLEPLLEKSTNGSINPTQLMQRVASSKYIKASRIPTGQDELVDLARIGKQFMAKKGGSDTAQKLAYMKGAGAALTGTGALYNLPATGAVVAGNKALQLVNQSPSVVRRAVQGTAGNPAKLPIASMLMGGASQQITGKP